MKNLFTHIRDYIIPPYCYAKACIGKSKTEIKGRYKKADFVELPDGMHSNFEFRILHCTITCMLRHGVCVSATIVPDKGNKYITYKEKETDQAQIFEAHERSVEFLGVEARAKHEQESPRQG